MRTPISDNEVDSMLSDSVLNMNLGHAQCSSHKDQVQRDFARHKKHRKRGNDYSGGGAFGGGRRK